MPLSPGSRFGTFEIVTLVGAGTMGEVYLSQDTRLQREVALKVLPDDVALDSERLARFIREAQLLASLNRTREQVDVGYLALLLTSDF